MPIIDIEGIQIEVDEDGFIQDPASWNEAWQLRSPRQRMSQS